MFKKLTALLLCLLIPVSFSSCKSGKGAGSQTGGSSETESRVKVSVSFNAMKEFVQAVGKEYVDISTIIPDGTEPHDFEPKAQDLEKLSSAQVFVYSGLGMEAWAEKAVSSAGNQNLVAVEASKGVEPITNTDESEIQEHGQYDPHVWISLKGAETETKNIRDALIQADPSHQNEYQANGDEFVTRLENLYQEYAAKFQAAGKKSFVTGHAAFAYLCRDFGLNQNSVEDVFAEGEPTPQQLGELVDFCKKNGVKTVFAEEMASPAVSKTLADEVGASVETIYTIESNEDDKSYLERQQENLEKIYQSLL